MPEYRNCGGYVTARFCRVFGTNDGEVVGCRGCLDMRQIVNEATV